MNANDIRADMAHEFGCKLDDMLDAARSDSSREEGARLALQVAVRKMADVFQAVDTDLDAGAFGAVDGPLAVASAIKKYLSQASAMLESGASTAESHRLMCQGRVQVLELLVGNTKKIHDMERGKADTKREAAEHGLPESRGHATGIAPGMPLKERRRLESLKSSESPAPAKQKKDKAD